MRNLIIVAGIAVALLLLAALFMDEGEVVTLITTDSEGHEFETGLWIVELDGTLHLRADSLKASWLARLQVRPDVQLRDEGRLGAYRAERIDDLAVRDRVDGAMARKYGWLNTTVGWVRRRADTVAIRLLPLAGTRSELDDGAPQ